MATDDGDNLAEIFVGFKEFQTLDNYFGDLSNFVNKLGFSQYLYTAVPAYVDQLGCSSHPIVNTSFDSSWIDYYLNPASKPYCESLMH